MHMNTTIRNILKCWKNSLENYNKLDNWKLGDKLSTISVIRSSENNKDLIYLIRGIRDSIISKNYTNERLLISINKALSIIDSPNYIPFNITPQKHKGRLKSCSLNERFKDDTHKIFEARLNFKKGMLLRNFDIEIESAKDSRKVRRIIEKRMCQAYHRHNKRTQNNTKTLSNRNRYWMKRATSFQLYNIGQVEHIKNLSRGTSTHWKKVYDIQTGELVFKKKTAYNSMKDALKAIEKWYRTKPFETGDMQAYKCAFCKKWHIGHKSETFNTDDIQLAENKFVG